MARKTKRAVIKDAADLPSREAILEFVRTAKTRASKREIAKAFNIKGDARSALKVLLADMQNDGLLSGKKKDMRAAGGLPSVTVLDIIATDGDGELIAEPTTWDEEDGARPRGRVAPGGTFSAPGRNAGRGGARGADRALGEGDRILARIEMLDADDAETDADYGALRFVARPMKRIARDRARLIGVFRATDAGGGIISPVEKKARDEWRVRREDTGKAEDGDLVRFDVIRAARGSMPSARVMDVLGNPSDQRQISLIAVHAHGIPDEFPEPVVHALDSLPDGLSGARADLTKLPLLTIDPPDARDHDDAICAEPDTAADNPGGHIVTVAIADVAAYVKPGTALDREARKRGNSCYFPDRVVPMLP
ncbi:MAG: RNB domain-containing ribonuclease, partial [Pseudomonadota bacterium]